MLLHKKMYTHLRHKLQFKPVGFRFFFMNPYATLGISSNATIETIKTAYRDLARQWHPDKNLDNPKAAEEVFVKIQAAYELLCNVHNGKANLNDNYYHQHNSPPQPKPPDPIGPNIVIELDLCLDAYFNGVTKNVTYSKKILCSNCNGQIIAGGCPKCNGTKYTNLSCELKIKILPGTLPGETFTFKGQADNLLYHQPGNVIVKLTQRISTCKNGLFRRSGSNSSNDLEINHTIKIQDALLGFEHKLQHMDDRILVIKPTSSDKIINHGSTIIIPSKGMPIAGTSKFGNLHVKISIAMPTMQLIEKNLNVHKIKILRDLLEEAQRTTTSTTKNAPGCSSSILTTEVTDAERKQMEEEIKQMKLNKQKLNKNKASASSLSSDSQVNSKRQKNV